MNVALAHNRARSPVDDESRIARFLKSIGTLTHRGEWPRVGEHLDRFLARYPERPEVLYVAAVAAYYADDIGSAADHGRRALDLCPDFREAADLLAIVYGLAGDLNACAFFAKLASVLPARPSVGAVLPDDFPNLTQVFSTISEKPLLHRAAEALVCGRCGEAARLFRQHLVFEPEDRDAYLGLGTALMVDGRIGEAVAMLRAGRHRCPDDAALASLLGRVLTEQARFSEAATVHRWAAAHAPDSAPIHAEVLVNRLYNPASDHARMAKAFRAWGRVFGIRDGSDLPVLKPDDADRPLVVGCLFGSVFDDVSGALFADILSRMDRSRFNIVGFGAGSLSDASNLILQKSCDRWQDVSEADPATLEAMVRGEEVDILVDCIGFADPAMLIAYGQRMAPCQVAWFGSPCGTGLAGMDFLIGDRFIDPDPSGAGLYAETLALMELGGVLVTLPDGEEPVTERPAGDEIIFACDAQLREIHPPAVEHWAEILYQVPGSTLLLRDHNFGEEWAAGYLLDLFGDFGVAHRVDIVRVPTAAAFYAGADIALLPPPMPRARGVVDALWAGLPVVCPASVGRHTRLAASVLHSLGLTDMIAETDCDYRARAVDWAKANDRRRDLRHSLRQRLKSADCFNPIARARDLETTMRWIWRTLCGT